MKCDIIIPVWNQLDITRRCIESIKSHTEYPCSLILIDNCSDAATGNYLKNLADKNGSINLIRNEENIGFIKATNQGLKISSSPYVCLMNNDTIATKGWLGKMVQLAESDSRIGLVNPKSESPGTLSLEEYSLRLSHNKGQYVETNQCMGFCMLIKREVIDRIGYLDEIYGMGGFDDTDFSKRTDLAGYKCVCAKEAYVYHDWHTSFGKDENREKLVRKNEEIFVNKWGRYLRIGYPITYSTKEDFYIDINTSLGFAREWNWVHAWLNSASVLQRDLSSMGLPEHQSLRTFNMSGVKWVFFLEVLFKLIERDLKKKKHFDLVMVSDRNLYNALSLFKPLFKTPIVFIKREEIAADKEAEELWSKRAREIVGSIRDKKEELR